ncbi:hypothetical protein ACHAWU_007750 [Discostella pseudostelligera]|uniref:Uncharacterized protein n=1 Tax=Discostella pseudostelligera TaxID=259834 RepID=A0ABD3N6B4_9STRA
MPEVDFDVNVTPLYDAIGKCDWDAASDACRRNPIEAKTWVVRREARPGDSDRERQGNDMSAVKILWRILPLHSACARNPPSSFVSQLIMAYPDAAAQKDHSGMYPLHYACGNRASRDVIKQLIENFPRAVREADPQGMLPLHYIAQWGPSEDGIVEMLLNGHAEGIAALNRDGMSPLDLCRESNYEDWEKVLSEMEGRSLTKLQSGGGGGVCGGGGGSGLRGKQMIVPRNEDSLLCSTIEVRKKIPSSLSIRDESYSLSKISTLRGPERVEVGSPCDARDEVSTRQSNHTDRGATPRSFQSMIAARSRDSASTSHSIAPHSITCSIASPRYHDMKTPRSSGRGPGFSFGSITPNASHSSSLGFNFERETYTRGRSNDGCGGKIGSNALRSSTPSSTSLMSQLSVRGDHGTRLRPSLSLPLEKDSLEKKERQGSLSQVKMGASYNSWGGHQAFEAMQAENAQLHAKLTNYLTIENENRQLHAKLANYHAVCHENQELRAALAKLNDIQSELSEIVGLLQRRESIRVSVSANRKKFLLEMLAAEENLDQEERSGLLYNGETLPMAMERQITSIRQLRNEMGHR